MIYWRTSGITYCSGLGFFSATSIIPSGGLLVLEICLSITQLLLKSDNGIGQGCKFFVSCVVHALVQS